MTTTLRRWLDIQALGIVAALEFEFFLPLVQKAAWKVPLGIAYTSWFLWILAGLSLAFLTFMLCEPLRLGKTRARYFHRYPPLWAAVVIGVLVAAASEWLPVPFRAVREPVPWQNVSILAPLLLSLGAGVGARYVSARFKTEATYRPYVSAGAIRWEQIAAWIASESAAEQDFFDFEPIYQRITSSLRDAKSDAAIALIGAAGAGKTTVLNWVRHELQECDDPHFVVANFNSWGIANPQDAPIAALQSVVQALEREVDVQAFSDLPGNYQRLVAAEPTGVLRNILGVVAGQDPLQAFHDLSPLLDAINSKVVVFVEDIERAGADFDTRHLQRLLFTLREVRNVSFVVSFDPAFARLDAGKLCDTIELVPPLDRDRVRSVLSVAYRHWKSLPGVIDPIPDKAEKDRLELSAVQAQVSRYMAGEGRGTPVEALVELLRSPRNLKHVLRRVDTSWSRLKGEVDLVQLIALCAVRHAAPVAFAYLEEHIDAARRESKKSSGGKVPDNEEWRHAVAKEREPRAVQIIADLFGLPQVSARGAFSDWEVPQGFQHDGPTDYFRRALAERVAHSETRDQTVLAEMDQWRARRSGPMLNAFREDDERSREYIRHWEHFAYRLSAGELLECCDVVLASIVRREGVRSQIRSDGTPDALFAVWRRLNRASPVDSYVDWLKKKIEEVLPISLAMANDLFYWFASAESNAVSGAGRVEVRAHLVACARKFYQDADALIGTLAKDHAYAVLHLVFGSRRERYEPLDSWQWLSSLLLDGAEKDADLVIPQIAALVTTSEHTFGAGGQAKWSYPIQRTELEELFPGRSTKVLRLLAGYNGDKEYVREIGTEAQRILDEADRKDAKLDADAEQAEPLRAGVDATDNGGSQGGADRG